MIRRIHEGEIIPNGISWGRRRRHGASVHVRGRGRGGPAEVAHADKGELRIVRWYHVALALGMIVGTVAALRFLGMLKP